MTPQQLKNSILQRAIEGRLVPQKAEEGTAKELLQKIQAEKAQLIAEKKIKKTKALPPISDEEIPFDIPDSWEWVRLSDVIDVRDGTHDTPKYQKSGIPLITSKNISNGKLDFENTKLIAQSDADKINERSKVEKNDILFAMIGSIGNPVLVDTDREFCIKNIALFKNYPNKAVYMEYVYYLMSHLQCMLKNNASGAVQSFVSLKVFRCLPIPLPPLAEQHRIVAKIEELLPFIDKYDKAYNKLTEFNARFPEDMKKSILQYAIEGKLVEQRKEEGTADALLQQIQAEKKRLIEEKKIKKTKHLPSITEDEIPFDIPDSWKWIRLGEICTYDQTKEKISKENILPDMWSLDMEDIEKGTGRIINIEKAGNRKIAGDKVVFHKGDILYSKLRPYLQKILIAPADGICTSELVPFYCYGDVNSHYITWLLRSEYVNQIANAESYGVKMPRVNKETMINILVPLPPLAEQHRIVAKIEELLPLCEQLIK